MKLQDLKPGTRVSRMERPATVIFSNPKHSVTPYCGYALIQYDGPYGWSGTNSALVPDGGEHIRLLHNLHWVHPKDLTLEELTLDFEVDI